MQADVVQLNRVLPILSFFTGGGLMDIGFEQAGFNIAWTNEYNPIFADMYESAISAWRRSRGEKTAACISCRDSIEDVRTPKILEEVFGRKAAPQFGVIGGPPCPDFSAGGLHEGCTGKNGRLTQRYADVICDLKPTFFVLENVAGLYRTKKHRQFLEQLLRQLSRGGRCAVDAAILNALDFGVPQDRDRLFVVGFERAVAEEAIGRRLLPFERDWFPWPKDHRFHDAKKRFVGLWPRISPFGSTPAKPDGIPDELMVSSVFSGDQEPEGMPNGTDYFKPTSPKFRQKAEGDVYSKSFKRLHRYRYSPTAWYGNNEVHLHPWKPRRLSVREALLIQSVPNEYVLPPNVPLSAKFKLVCNGVPCVVARQLATAISRFLAADALHTVPTRDRAMVAAV